LHLELYPLRFCFLAREAIEFPRGKAGNTLRGALGTVLRPGEHARGRGPSGLSDPPQPFVLRASHLDGRRVCAGEEFSFDLHLFDLSAFSNVVQGLRELTTLGARRGQVELKRVASSMDGSERIIPIRLELESTSEVRRLRVRFVTPTELKSEQQIVAHPEFGVLAARIRDRISMLRELYGPGPLEIDFREFGKRAAEVRMTRCEMEAVEVERRSSRTGQRHSIGGFVGEAEYEGDLTEFVPYLRAAEWTGVGRQTVWGKGVLRVLASC
jgi:hypothetical protein